ncbi:MAG: acyltransferase family protein [Alphaproteobacteria bacterium]|nr:acyltransferase family protein [Alphaproteobacteria bacterium]
MIVLFFFVAIISLLGIKRRNEVLESSNQGYLSKDSTNAIKGIFILLVFIRHANQYVKQVDYDFSRILDRLFILTDGLLAQLIVVMFLFFSGYGIMCSINRGGQKYIRTIPKKRLLNTLINFDIAVLIYFILAVILKRPMSCNQVLLSFIGWDGMGNSNWYIFVILCCYLSSFLAFSLINYFKHSKAYRNALLLNTFFIILIAVFLIKEGKPRHWYDTIMVYPLGMWFALYKSYFECFVAKSANYSFLLIVSIIVFVMSYGLLALNITSSAFDWFLWSIRVLSLILTIILIMKKWNIGNKFIVWAGANLFPLYIYQRLPMLILAPYLSDKPYAFFALTFIVSCALIFVYKKIEVKLL